MTFIMQFAHLTRLKLISQSLCCVCYVFNTNENAGSMCNKYCFYLIRKQVVRRHKINTCMRNVCSFLAPGVGNLSYGRLEGWQHYVSLSSDISIDYNSVEATILLSSSQRPLKHSFFCFFHFFFFFL